MSGAFSALATVGSLGSQALSASGVLPAFIRNTRKIDTIIPDVVVTERHTDRLVVTQHPVADNTPISDHAYRMPAVLTMQCGWSNSNVVGAAVSGFMSGGLAGAGSSLLASATEQRVKDIYSQLLDLQFGKQRNNPDTFSVTTGKRNYTNMMITELSVSTDRHSEYALIVQCTMQEVIKAKIATTTAPAQQDQKKAETTTETADKGKVQPNPNDSPLIGGWGEEILRKYAPSWVFSPTSSPGAGGGPSP